MSKTTKQKLLFLRENWRVRGQVWENRGESNKATTIWDAVDELEKVIEDME